MFNTIVLHISGIGGIGKSTILKYLALSWADGQSDLNKFDFVFHIALKHVNDKSSIANIIINQHAGLSANNVTEKEMVKILSVEFGTKSLILIDGYDEYHRGTNAEIDSALEKGSLWNCWVILTSRPFQAVDLLKPFFDAEAVITGFNEENVQNYASKFLENEERGATLLRLAKTNTIVDMLQIPLILQMTCVIYESTQSVPESKTEAARSIVDLSIQYAVQRQAGSKVKPKLVKKLLVLLGKMAWASLQENERQLLLNKVAIKFDFAGFIDYILFLSCQKKTTFCHTKRRMGANDHPYFF